MSTNQAKMRNAIDSFSVISLIMLSADVFVFVSMAMQQLYNIIYKQACRKLWRQCSVYYTKLGIQKIISLKGHDLRFFIRLSLLMVKENISVALLGIIRSILCL